MLSYSISQMKWRVTTEAENSATGSAFVFSMEIIAGGIAGRICTTGASFAQAAARRKLDAPKREGKAPPSFSTAEQLQGDGAFSFHTVLSRRPLRINPLHDPLGSTSSGDFHGFSGLTSNPYCQTWEGHLYIRDEPNSGDD